MLHFEKIARDFTQNFDRSDNQKNLVLLFTVGLMQTNFSLWQVQIT